jgi:ABC-type dipeptide/oligopeptide/nickel transport system ATPase component
METNNIYIELISLQELVRLKKIIDERINILSNNIPLTNTDLSNKTLNTLRKNNITTISQLKNININTITRIGLKGKSEIEETLQTYKPH